MRTLWVIAGILGMMCLPMRADDWPQWRGPQRDGVWRERGIMQTFPPEGLKVRWRVESGGSWPSPVVARGRVYLHDSEMLHPRAHERLRCFDAETGQILWTYAYEVDYPDWAYNAEQNGGPVATPAVVDGKIYALGANGDAVCANAETGEVLWHRDLGRDFQASGMVCRASPLVDANCVILCVGGKPAACVIALDRETGGTVWTALDEPVANSSPIIAEAAGRRQLIVWTGESVSALDPQKGTLLWRYAVTTGGNDFNATPVWSGDRLLLSGLMLKLDKEKPGATLLWPQNAGAMKRILSNTSTPLISGDVVYSATNRGELVCLDAKTGNQIWITDKVTARKTGPSIHITPNGDSALLYTDEGNLVRAGLTPSGYEELSRTRLIEPVYLFGGHKLAWAPPAFANRCVFVANEKQLICVSLAADPK